MAESHQSNQSLRTDGFQRAAASAETEAGEHRWSEMLPWERTRAIYAHLRRIDGERATAMAFSPGRSGRFRVAGGAIDRAAEDLNNLRLVRLRLEAPSGEDVVHP
jgi:hypothetical protein